MNPKFEISLRTIFLTLAVLAGLWVVIQIKDILYLIFIALLLMTAIYPLVIILERIRIPRAIGILFIYAVVFGFFGASLVGAVPAIIAQSNRLTQEFPNFVARVLPYWNIDVSTISAQLAPIGESIVKVTLGIFSNIVTFVTVLVFTFYFLMERPHSEDILRSIVGASAARQTLVILRAVERRLGAWVRGQLLLMITVGALSFIGLTVLRIEFALPLAILAGVLEIVPMIGPVISAIPAILVALATSPILALSVAALYIVVQQIENNILVPIIMKQSVGFAPIVTILTLMIGGRLAGVTGAILSIPVALAIQEIVTAMLFKKQESPTAAKKPSKS